MTELEILRKAITTLGSTAQRNMLIEKIGDLLNAIGKQPRGRASNEDIIEEIADVVIVCEQIAISISYDDYREKRLDKLALLETKLNKH